MNGMGNGAGTVRDVAYWLSYEDCLMSRENPAENGRYFVIWRATPCVVIGRNQIAEAEVDLDKAGRDNVAITRRTSGGGAVYIDPKAVQYAVIQPYTFAQGEGVKQIAREQVARMAASALKQFGVPAEVEGRNDITANGAKISGISQFVRGSRLCTHGTLLFDTDLEYLSKILKPDTEKFLTKAVQSVRSRVANVKPFLTAEGKARILELAELLIEANETNIVGGDDIDVGLFMAAFEAEIRREAVSDGSPFINFEPSSDELETIDKIYRELYANPENIFQKTPPYTYQAARRFPSGRTQVFVNVRKGAVSSCAIRGDFIGYSPIESLENSITGLPFRREDFTREIKEETVADCLGGIKKTDFINLIFGE